MRLRAVVDHQAVAELLGDPDRGGNVVMAVHVLVPDQLAIQYGGQRFVGQIPIEGLALGGRRRALGRVVFRRHERIAQHRRYPKSGGGQRLAIAVHALRVLAQCRLHRDGIGDDLLIHRAPAPGLDRHGAAADRVSGTGLDHHGGHAATQRVTEADLLDVDPVQRAEPGAVRVGHLVGVVTRPPLTVLMNAEVTVRLHKPGQHPRSAGVHHAGVARNGDILPDGDDHAIRDQHRSAGDGRGGNGHDVAAGDCEGGGRG